jgi:hypothetical protein
LAAQYARMGRMFTDQGALPEARAMFAAAIRHFPGRLDAYPRLLATLLGRRVVSGLVALSRWQRG